MISEAPHWRRRTNRTGTPSMIQLQRRRIQKTTLGGATKAATFERLFAGEYIDGDGYSGEG